MKKNLQSLWWQQSHTLSITSPLSYIAFRFLTGQPLFRAKLTKESAGQGASRPCC
ncbi:hypothetical protein IC229_22315 [Spirosoma sp. BT702]|uniref:Uncharacterized protein n=1 Tax=Spirosoma profusum TaxID=2771354 RepID=A0A927ATF6_9BACT|nr:hypothetical protein [Spirosoma profusum]MBD2703395.1 hypothetical protein [Spirosoma profusum]